MRFPYSSRSGQNRTFQSRATEGFSLALEGMFGCADQVGDVRFGSKADMCSAQADVRFGQKRTLQCISMSAKCQ